MSDKLNIVCFLWHGDRWDDSVDGVEYVNRLYRGMKRNLSLSFGFICFSTVEGIYDSGIDVREFDSPSWRGCLPKLTVFNPDHNFQGRVVMCDIDCVITGSLDEMFSYDGDICLRAKFIDLTIPDGDLVGFRAGFGVKEIWQQFKDNPLYVADFTGGRERYWYRETVPHADLWQQKYPGMLLSYKRNIRPKGGLFGPEVKMISCHGKPRPHEIKESWIKEHWI